MIGIRQRIGHMTVVGHPTNFDVWSVTTLYIKVCWCYSLPITMLALGHVGVGVIIILFILLLLLISDQPSPSSPTVQTENTTSGCGTRSSSDTPLTNRRMDLLLVTLQT